MTRTFLKTTTALYLGASLLALPALTAAAEPAAPSATPSAPAAAPMPSPAAPAAGQPAAAPTSPASPAPPAIIEKKEDTTAPTPVPKVKIGYVDIGRIGQDSKQGKAAQAQLKAKKDKLQGQINAKQKQLEKQKTTLEESLPKLSPTERAAKAKDFEKKVDEYRKLVQKAEGEMKPLQEELTLKVFQQIEKAASAYGRANGFTAIVTPKDILYLGTGALPEDITDAILKEMDAAAK